MLAYQRLGQSEDPPFTFKVMVVKTNWPGAAAREVEQQVTDRIERKLQEVPNVDWVRSYTKPGESLVFFALKDSAPAGAGARDLRTRCARRSATSATRCPPGIQGPFFNDEFGDTYTNIYALTGDGFGYRELKEFGDSIRAELLRVPGVAKVDFIGEQDEKVFIELSNSKLATLGVEPAQIIADARGAERGGGVGRVRHRAPTASSCGRPARSTRVDAIRDIAIRANNRVFRLGDIAEVTRGYVDPPQQKMRLQGKEALGIGVTMAQGRRRHRARPRPRRARSRASQQALPVGVELAHGREHAARRAALDQPVPALARRGGAHRARRVAREPRPAHGPRRRGVDPAGARDHVPRSCGCSTSACTRSRSAR